MEDIEKLRQFVEAIAKQTTREEENGWEPKETGISDTNQDITLAQADWADSLIEEARKLTEVKGPDQMFQVQYRSPQILGCNYLTEHNHTAQYRTRPHKTGEYMTVPYALKNDLQTNRMSRFSFCVFQEGSIQRLPQPKHGKLKPKHHQQHT